MTGRAVSIAGCAICAALLPACVSVLPEQPRPEAVYQLALPGSQIPIATNVVIREPDAPRLFANRSIVAEGAGGGLRVVAGIAWADRATRMLQVTLLDAISSAGEGVAIDDTAGVSGAYELYWRVLDFTLKGDEGVCSVQLTLMDGRSRDPVAQGVASANVRAITSDKPARAQALAQAGRDCAIDAAEFIAGNAVERPVTPADTAS